MPQPTVETITTDVLILGSGLAGLFAALHAYNANPRAAILIVVKGLVGKSGCTRMVQGGYNAVLHPSDSLDQHFRDTIEGGAYLNDQEPAWRLIKTAPERIHELESRMGCFFDRNPDGTIHQKAFAGQSFDRTVHRGDLTGAVSSHRSAGGRFQHEPNGIEGGPARCRWILVRWPYGPVFAEVRPDPAGTLDARHRRPQLLSGNHRRPRQPPIAPAAKMSTSRTTS
jgi:hypothetical protein